MNVDADTRVRVLLSIQRALLGMVTPALRGVAVSWEERSIRGRFIYDSYAGDNAELVGEIETEVLADFDRNVATHFVVEEAAPPATLTLGVGEVWVYMRREA